METTFNDLIDNTDHDSEFYKIVLFLFYLNAVNKADHTWDEFAEELIYKNRFSSKNDILEELHKKATDATHMIAKGTVLYRSTRAVRPAGQSLPAADSGCGNTLSAGLFSRSAKQPRSQ